MRTVDNLKERILWFSKPARFNDPFDCSIPFKITDIDQSDWILLFNMLREKVVDKEKFDEDYLSNKLPNEKFKEKNIESAIKASKDKINEYHQRGVACFSENVDDILMWSHYSEGHRGFCLEFNTKFDPFQKAQKVIYSTEYPSINPADVLLRRLPYIPTALLTTKSNHWAYEKEWRIIHEEGDKEYSVEASALTGIYFGCEMPFVHKEILSLILSQSPTTLYEMIKSEGEFKVTYESRIYEPYDYKKSKS